MASPPGIVRDPFYHHCDLPVISLRVPIVWGGSRCPLGWHLDPGAFSRIPVPMTLRHRAALALRRDTMAWGGGVGTLVPMGESSASTTPWLQSRDQRTLVRSGSGNEGAAHGFPSR